MDARIKIKRLNIPVYFVVPYLILVMLSIKTGYARYLSFFFAFIFIATALITCNEIKIKRKYISLIMFFIIYVTLGLFYGDVLQILKNISMLILNLTPFFIFDYFSSLNNSKKMFNNIDAVKKTMSLLLIYTMGITTYYLYKNPYIARYMANFDPSRGIDSSMGINIDLPTAIGGGYVLIYGIILLPPLYTFLIKNQKINLNKKIKLIIVTLTILFFVIKAGFATAFILSVGSTLITFILTGKKKIINKIILIFILLLFLITISNPSLLTIVIEAITKILPESSIISVRLNEIVPAIYGISNDVTSFSMRISGLQKSINTIIKNPLLGVGYKVGFDYISVSNYASLHTEWIDILAQYGIFFGGFLLVYIGLSFKDLARKFKNTEMNMIIKILITAVIILGFLNPIFTSSTYVILMVYVPCYLMNYSNKEMEI